MIAGLSAERYHHRLEAYRTAITSQEGVTEAAHEYLAGGAGEPGQLVFSFNFSGNLAVLEDHIWASLVATGETPNRQLTAVSERLIQYQAGGEAVLTAVFRNVAAAEYSRVREALDSIFGNLEVRNLTRDYNDKTRVLSYNFESGQAMVELERANGTPDVTIKGGYRRLDESNDNAVTFGISIPLQIFNRNQGAIAEAQHRLAKVQQERRAAELKINQNFLEAYQSLVS
mgnify:CR=1 FL=1